MDGTFDVEDYAARSDVYLDIWKSFYSCLGISGGDNV